MTQSLSLGVDLRYSTTKADLFGSKGNVNGLLASGALVYRF